MDLIRRTIASAAALVDRPSIPWKTLILTFALGEYTLETYLAYRQYQVLKRTQIPSQLKREIDQATYDKSQEYGRAKAQYAFCNKAFETLKAITLLRYNGYAYLWSASGSLLASTFANPDSVWRGEIAHSLLWITAYTLLEKILSTPWDLYYHFVLEAQFGFNKQTPSLFVTDFFKSLGLGLLFGLPIGAAFLKIIQLTGDNFFLYIWAFTMVVQLTAVTIFPIWIVPLFNKLTPLPPGPLKEAVERLASRLEFPLGELQVIDGSKRSAHSNAYFTGLPWKKKIVLYDTLIERSDEKEVEAILAHELGHWKMGHILQQIAISSAHLFALFFLFSIFINNASLYRAFGFTRQQPILVGFILFNEVLSPTDALIKLAMNIWTRSMEFEADAFAHKLGYASELASSLIKLQIQNLSSMDADWMYSTYHYSHPILTERLKAVGWTSEKKVASSQPKVGPAEKEL
ncbi:CAAX prenyl protease 1-like [Teratosphaeria destructans]|uniref:CAAX prenyl protease n=1 Tax=Teratosphaeria destructans TaxID=418781 RepID=A0A9W7T1M5_9PEZI|nr:CAAX prenyl protease 1-like [Teratosphaeria destructans]